MQVSIHRQETNYRIRDSRRLKLFLKSLFLKEATLADSVDIILCSDEYLLEINRQFLQHDYYTDIISFNLAAPKAPLTGELYISLERVKENAKSEGTSLNKELHRVIFHGCLHLCGYGDKSKKEAQLMRGKEEYYLNLYFSYS